jgi:Flp pilus assembly pilin Flp
MFAYVIAAMRSLIRNDSAQDAFEYLLVVGGVTVAVILAIATPVGSTIVDAVLDGVCTAIGTIPNIGSLGNCTP